MNVVIIGQTALDIKVHTDAILKSGQTAIANAIHTFPGGPGRNIAEVLGRLGWQPILLSVVDDDPLGELMLSITKEAGADVGLVYRVPSAATSTFVSWSTNALEEPYIALENSVNNRLDIQYLQSALRSIEGKVDVAIVHSEFIDLVSQVRQERLAGSRIAVTVKLEQSEPHLLDNLRDVEWVFLNQRELQALTSASFDSLQSIAYVAKSIIDLGCHNIVITLGSDGMIVGSAQGCYHVPVFEVEVVDTTGAGDTVVGAFIAAQMKGKDLLESGLFASAAASITVSNRSTIPVSISSESVSSIIKHKTNTTQYY